MPESRQRVLSMDEAEAAARGITSAADPSASFAEMEVVYGRRFPTVLSELAGAGLDGHLAVLGHVYRLPRVGPELARAIGTGGGALIKEVGAEGARELRRQVRSEMEDFLRVAGRAGVPVDDLTAAVELLGLKRIAGTGDVSRSATSAVRDLIGRRFHVAETWYAPHEIAGEPTDPKRIEAWLEAAKTEKAIRALAPGKRGAERDGLIRAAVDAGVWVTNGDGTGAVLMVPDADGTMTPLADARGMRLEVDFLEASRPTLAEAGRGDVRAERVSPKEVVQAVKGRKARQPEAVDGLVGGDGEDTLAGGAEVDASKGTGNAQSGNEKIDPLGAVRSGVAGELSAQDESKQEARAIDPRQAGGEPESSPSAAPHDDAERQHDGGEREGKKHSLPRRQATDAESPLGGQVLNLAQSVPDRLGLDQPTAERARKQLEDLNQPGSKPSTAEEARTLLKALAGNPELRKKHTDKLHVLYERLQIDDTFKAYNEERREKLRDAFVRKGISKTLRSWDDLDLQQRQEALRAVVRETALVYDLDPPPTVEFEDLPGNTAAVHRRQTRTIIFDPSNDMFLIGNDLALTIGGAAIHETVHAYQASLVKDYSQGHLSPDDPRYSQAELFLLNSMEGMYVRSEDGLEAYWAQPLEKHANEIASKLDSLFRASR